MKTLALFLLALLCCTPGAAAAEGVRESHPNLVGGEVLGRGLLFTVNYEHYFNNHFGLGGGFMGVGSSSGVLGVMPLYASVLTGDTHSLYLAAGATLVGGGGSVHDYEGTWVQQFSIGYHFQSPSGFFVRPLLTFNRASGGGSGDYLIWPGMTIGGSF